MKINEYGKNKEVLLMFPPLSSQSDVYDFVCPRLEKRFQILVAYPGIDDGIKIVFSSVEQLIDDKNADSSTTDGLKPGIIYWMAV